MCMAEGQAREEYNDAKRRKEAAQQDADYNRRLRNSAEEDIRDCRTRKNNLNDRLEDLNRIIRIFDNDLTRQFNEADKKAIDAEDMFSAAVLITEGSVSKASVKNAFGTESVFANNDTNNAYTVCVKERDRVLTAISNLESEISNLRIRINTLDSNVRYYNGLASRYDREMREYQRYF